MTGNYIHQLTRPIRQPMGLCTVFKSFGSTHFFWGAGIRRQFTALFLVFLAVFTCLPPPGAAADHLGRRKGFDARDANKDGRLVWIECVKVYEKRFERLDQDGDGFLTLADLEEVGLKLALLTGMTPFKADGGSRITRKFKTLDADRDDRMDLDEFLSRRRRQFTAMDRDGNSFVTLSEYMNFTSENTEMANDGPMTNRKP